MNLLTTTLQAAQSTDNPSGADIEQAKIGAAAERKRREEAEDSLSAALKSDDANGKAVRWERRIRVNGPGGKSETRTVAMFERAGAYADRSFLNLCKSAARKAAPRSSRSELTIEAIAAELCASVLTKTAGRMPKVGTLGKETGRDGDERFLTAAARSLVTDAMRPDRRDRLGLSSEIAPMAAAEGATYFGDSSDPMSCAEDAAESRDDYLSGAELDRLPFTCDGEDHRPQHWNAADWQDAEHWATIGADPLNWETHVALKRLAVETGSPKAVTAALLRAYRPLEVAPDLAAAGYGKSSGSLRTAASEGTKKLVAKLQAVPAGARHMTAADWRFADALAEFCACEAPAQPERHPLESNGGRKSHAANLIDAGFSGRPRMDWEPQGEDQLGAGKYIDASGDLRYFSRDENGCIVIWAAEG
jgi:hypothetical protein